MAKTGAIAHGCGECHQPGHNRRTCPLLRKTSTPTTAPAGVATPEQPEAPLSFSSLGLSGEAAREAPQQDPRQLPLITAAPELAQAIDRHAKEAGVNLAAVPAAVPFDLAPSAPMPAAPPPLPPPPPMPA
jgi:hypothetical protein